MEQLLRILEDICPGTDVAACKTFIDDELIDSFDMVSLVGEIMDTFDVEIDVDDLIPENFNSAEAMMKLIESRRD